MQSVSAQQYVAAGADFRPPASFKPANANASGATAAAVNGGRVDPKHASQQWQTEGHAQYAGQQNPDALMRAKRAQNQPPVEAPVQVPFEGRSTAADSYARYVLRHTLRHPAPAPTSPVHR